MSRYNISAGITAGLSSIYKGKLQGRVLFALYEIVIDETSVPAFNLEFEQGTRCCGLLPIEKPTSIFKLQEQE
jgi:hypothetical protein